MNMLRMPSTEYINFLTANKPKKKRKYRNIPTQIDGVKFDSKKEAAHYLKLLEYQKLGLISNLTLQPEFIFPNLKTESERDYRYKADFSYLQEGKLVVEDVKSPASKTPVYQLKKALLKREYGIEIREVL